MIKTELERVLKVLVSLARLEALLREQGLHSTAGRVDDAVVDLQESIIDVVFEVRSEQA